MSNISKGKVRSSILVAGIWLTVGSALSIYNSTENNDSNLPDWLYIIYQVCTIIACIRGLFVFYFIDTKIEKLEKEELIRKRREQSKEQLKDLMIEAKIALKKK